MAGDVAPDDVQRAPLLTWVLSKTGFRESPFVYEGGNSSLVCEWRNHATRRRHHGCRGRTTRHPEPCFPAGDHPVRQRRDRFPDGAASDWRPELSGERARLQRQLAELDRAGSCAHPIRIAAVHEGAADKDRVLLVSCKDRRSSVCPACSYTYKGDAWQVVATGMRGGKGVTSDVGIRPRVFLTLTAPSFGPVHTCGPRGAPSRPCRRSHQTRCRHGVSAECRAHHDVDDPLLGQPICAACFDYVGAVLWNATVLALWRRTANRLARALGRRCDNGRDDIRLSYVKPAEFQRRGLVHLHVVFRVDGGDGPDASPPAWVAPEMVIDDLEGVVPHVSTTVTTPTGPSTIGWGAQMVATPIAGTSEDDNDRHLAVAAYVAKYATKTADAAGSLDRRIKAWADIALLDANDHQKRLVATAWRLNGVAGLEKLGLRRCANTFGYRGHVVTKSRMYSTTFSALRGARAEFQRTHGAAALVGDDVHFGYAGRGYDDPATGFLAYHLTRLATMPGSAPTDKDGAS